MKYHAIFFDVGGVLMSMDRDRVAREYVALARSRRVTLDFAAVRAMVAALDDEIPARARLAPPLSLDERAGETFWKTLFADGWSRLALVRDDAAIAHFYREFRRGAFNRAFDDARPALDALQARGVTLGVISNFTPNCAEVLETLGLKRYFAHIVVSALVRVEKPARAIFDHAAQLAQRDPRELVYVGDGLHTDVDGARGAGWDAILLDRDNWYPDYRVVPRVRRLTELAEVLQSAV
ncbi:MAG: HAD-IA family hydrolase [Chloroflexi bacterium]|nr:HAD-IA family hydrolase [Chloroflexota bacterium]